MVVKGADDLEKFAPLAAIGSRIAGSLAARAGKKKLGKVGVTSATAGTAGKSSLDQAMDMATDSGPPATGFGTKTLENTATSAPKQSMTNLDGGGAAIAGKNPTDMGSLSATDTTPIAPKKEKPNPLMRDRSAPAGQSTLKPDDPTLSAAVEESKDIQAERERIKDANSYAVPKPLQRFLGKRVDKDVAQNIGAVGLVGVQQRRAKGAQEDAARQQEMERIERIAEDGRAKANTGAKVAVA